MEVKIAFDTEKESVDDLRRLITAIQDLITRREKSSSLGNPLAGTKSVTMQTQVQTQQSYNQNTGNSYQASQPAQQAKETPDPKNYSGHGRLTPYEDMSDKMADIFSKGRL